jgi:RNA recognition motif-containing protein
LPYSIDDARLGELFAPFGEIESAKVITDRETGQSRGFGFVEMTDPAEAEAAIDALNGSELGGRSLTVNEARPREQRGGTTRGGGGERRGGEGWGRDKPGGGPRRGRDNKRDRW